MHVDVEQKSNQYCKAIILQLKKKKNNPPLSKKILPCKVNCGEDMRILSCVLHYAFICHGSLLELIGHCMVLKISLILLACQIKPRLFLLTPAILTLSRSRISISIWTEFQLLPLNIYY